MALQFSATKVNNTKTAVIADNGTVSEAINLEDGTLVGVYIPTGFVGTALTFQASNDGTNFFAVNVLGGALSYTVAASKYVGIDPKDFYGVKYVKFVSGSSETGGPLTLTASIRTMR